MIQITDTRPRWMIKEDRHAECLRAECRLIVNCQSKYGKECKHINGNLIPKVGVRG